MNNNIQDLDLVLRQIDKYSEKSIQRARAAIHRYYTSEFNKALGENEHYDEMCEHCNDWDDGRNELREQARLTWEEQ
jgi:hypothetical protein